MLSGRLKYLLPLSLLVFSCTKENTGGSSPVPDSNVPIVFRLADPGGTKAVSEVTTANLSSFYVAATRGSAGSETSAWTSTLFTKSGDEFKGGKYWPSADLSYHFYGSNLGLTFGAGGTTVSPTGTDLDVIVAYLPSPSYQYSNAFIFNHIFGRIGTMTVIQETGYTITGISITMTPVVPRPSGTTYNIRTGVWSGTQNGAPATLSSNIGTKTNNFLLVPGSYTLTANFTATIGDYTATLHKSATITIPAGLITNISCTLSGDAQEVVFNVTVEDWSEQDFNLGRSFMPSVFDAEITVDDYEDTIDL